MSTKIFNTSKLPAYFRTYNYVVNNYLYTPRRVAVVHKSPHILHPARNLSVPISNIIISSGPGLSTQIRWSHTDYKVPDFNEYRRKALQSPTAVTSQSEVSRKSINYLGSLTAVMATIYSVKANLNCYLGCMAASADVLALAKIEINLADIPEGVNSTIKWRGKPLFVKHRTPAEIEDMKNVSLSSLRHPEKDEDRVQRPEWLVVIGVCTHLGCVPVAGMGDYAGGYYCPCHGSHFDASGRIRKGPAPTNLEIPPYEFSNETSLVVG